MLTRQAFLTFGDASWGTVKMGKDLGIFASDAILNDITLLGVGGLATGGITTLGGIGSGYLYPAFRGQIAYTTPNMNGLQVTLGITNPDQGQNTAGLATDYELQITVNALIKSEVLEPKKIVFEETFTMKKFDDPFEEKNYEKIIKDNFSDLILERILFYLFKL